mmetsp:Transcript_38177/g.65008  ORF Transcript_38177/g.65008 Transcript_38177/m.65008 type:complete len:157 (+) Transcript_38177:20-490(+)
MCAATCHFIGTIVNIFHFIFIRDITFLGKALTLSQQQEDDPENEDRVAWVETPPWKQKLKIEASLLAALKRKAMSRTGHLTPTKQVKPSFMMRLQIEQSRRDAFVRLEKSASNATPPKKQKKTPRSPPSRPPSLASRLRFLCDGLDLLDDEPNCWG